MALFNIQWIAIFILVTLEKVWCHGDLISLDLRMDADRRRFLVDKNYFRGIQYETIRPMPGCVIDSVVFGPTQIFKRIPGADSIGIVYIYYNEFNHNIPLFIIKSDAQNEHAHFKSMSPSEFEHQACIITLMKYVKLFVPSVKVQEQLIDIDNEEPGKISLNTVIYRIYNGDKYLGGNKNIMYGPMLTDEDLASRGLKKSSGKRKRGDNNEDPNDSGNEGSSGASASASAGPSGAEAM